MGARGRAHAELTAEFSAVRDGDALREIMWKRVMPLGVTHVAAVSLKRYMDGEVRLSALQDVGPAEVSIAILTDRYPNFHKMALEMLHTGRPFDHFTSIVETHRKDFDAVWQDHKAALGCDYYYCVPVHERGEPQGYCSYLGNGPFGVDVAARLKHLTALAYECAKRLGLLAHEVSPLTARQCDVLRLCAEGLSDAEIGARLGISAVTAHEHIEAAKRRLDVRTRVQAVVRAMQGRWLVR